MRARVFIFSLEHFVGNLDITVSSQWQWQTEELLAKTKHYLQTVSVEL